MIPTERNDYVETIRPILCCFRINGILPMQLVLRNYKSNFLASKGISALTQTIYLLNFVYNLVTLCEIVVDVRENFNLKIFIVFAPQIFLKFIIIIIPFDMWTKSSRLRDYWSRWKDFQDEYEKISETIFNSDKTKTVQKIILVANLFIFMGEMIVQLYISYGTNYTRILSDYLNISTVYYLGAYWYINCMYVKSVARKITSVVKTTMEQEENGDKLREIISLWVRLCELMEHFYVIHSLLFLVYIIQTIVAMTIFAFICMNSSTFTDIYGVGIQLNGLFVCMFMIFLICETAYSVYKQVTLNQRKLLLMENSMRMDKTKLQSVSLFLETMFVKKPEVCIRGYLTLNRSVFVTILAVCINYLIVLRQFQ